MPGGAGSRAPGGTWPPGTCTWARIIVSKACAWAGSSRLAGCKPGGRRPWRKAAVGKAAESLRLASAREVAGGKRKGGKGKGEPACKSGPGYNSENQMVSLVKPGGKANRRVWLGIRAEASAPAQQPELLHQEPEQLQLELHQELVQLFQLQPVQLFLPGSHRCTWLPGCA